MAVTGINEEEAALENMCTGSASLTRLQNSKVDFQHFKLSIFGASHIVATFLGVQLETVSQLAPSVL